MRKEAAEQAAPQLMAALAQYPQYHEHTADFLFPTAEDNMNVQLKDITVTARDGRVSHLDQVYIRGSHVRFFIVPDMLRYVSLAITTPLSISSKHGYLVWLKDRFLNYTPLEYLLT